MTRIFRFLLILLGSFGYDSVMAQSTGSLTATVNLDLSTGIALAGGVNVIDCG